MIQAGLEIAVLSVSQLVERVQGQLMPLNPVVVQGEIASHTRSGLGHQYFELKDERAKIRCVIFKGSIPGLPVLQNGLLIKIRARANVYAPQGALQLKVDAAEPLGDGLLRLRFEKIKKKLAAEGLFDEARKKPLPPWPEKIVLITSESAAAYHDVCKTLKLTWPCLRVLFLPVSVQGADSVRDIVAALRYANRKEIASSCDLVMLVRGGGSLDDLWSFNEEAVVRACARLQLPLVTGIGHEIDFTLCDLVADLRGATPTAAASAISPGRDWLGKHIREQTLASTRRLESLWQRDQTRLDLARQRLRGQSPENEVERLRQNVDLWQSQARQCVHEMLWRSQEKTQLLRNQVLRHHPLSTINRRTERVRLLSSSARKTLEEYIHLQLERVSRMRLALAARHPTHALEKALALARAQQMRIKLSHPARLCQALAQRLEAGVRGLMGGGGGIRFLSAQTQKRLIFLQKQLQQSHPDKILGRGYALLTDGAGRLIRGKADAIKQEYLNVRVSDGSFRVRPLPDSDGIDADRS